ncbi:hypothetical protein [Kitasatospora sp. NPDC047058]|uniref:hypothetical protein n=1 Tax=Kitasatospora sp. NPDC047058 TaxID=3155620 RepID=UPI0033F4B3C1
MPSTRQPNPAYISSEDLDRLRNTGVALQRGPNVDEPPVSLSAFVAAAVILAVVEAACSARGRAIWG